MSAELKARRGLFYQIQASLSSSQCHPFLLSSKWAAFRSVFLSVLSVSLLITLPSYKLTRALGHGHGMRNNRASRSLSILSRVGLNIDFNVRRALLCA